MIPISDNIRCQSKPIINYWLIGINIAIFLWELKLEFSDELGYFVNNWGVIPAKLVAHYKCTLIQQLCCLDNCNLANIITTFGNIYTWQF